MDTDLFRPVTWSELGRVQKDSNRLLAIFAEQVADIAAKDREEDPLEYMRSVTNAVSVCVLPVRFRQQNYHFFLDFFVGVAQGDPNSVPDGSR